MDKIIFHIDVNSAFLSWSAVKLLEEGGNVDIREITAIVGGDRQSRHGIVLAKSIAAKKYGIYTAQTIADALKKCPDLVIVPPEHNYYKEQSEKFVSMLREYTPDVEQVSIDECYLDFTGIRNQYESAQAAALIIKDRIKNELGFTVNVGISDRKVLAKMASDFMKPDRVHTLFHDEIERKMWGLDISDLFMAGKSSVATMRKLGINTIGELAKTPVEIVELHMKSHGKTLWEYANGIDADEVSLVKEDAKGIGHSTTLSRDINDVDEANRVLLTLSDMVAERLRKSHCKAKVVCVEIKYSNFTKVSKQITVDSPVSIGNEIYVFAKKLYKELWDGSPVRLIGIRTTKLADEDEPEQMSLFDFIGEFSNGGINELSGEDSHINMGEQISENIEKKEKMKNLEHALDNIRERYGNKAVMRASSYVKEESND